MIGNVANIGGVSETDRKPNGEVALDLVDSICCHRRLFTLDGRSVWYGRTNGLSATTSRSRLKFNVSHNLDRFNLLAVFSSPSDNQPPRSTSCDNNIQIVQL
jgi:hypothetical protein